MFHSLEAAGLGTEVKQWPTGSLSPTDVLRSKRVQQKDQFPAKCLILASVKLREHYNKDKCSLTVNSVHRDTKNKMLPVILIVHLSEKPS